MFHAQQQYPQNTPGDAYVIGDNNVTFNTVLYDSDGITLTGGALSIPGGEWAISVDVTGYGGVKQLILKDATTGAELAAGTGSAQSGPSATNMVRLQCALSLNVPTMVEVDYRTNVAGAATPTDLGIEVYADIRIDRA